MFKVKREAVFALLIAGLLMAPAVALAESTEKPPAPPSGDEIVSKMEQQLNLSEEQVSQIKAVIEDNIAKVQEVIKKNLDTKSFRDQTIELQKDMEVKISQYLTADQLIQWKNRKQGRPERRMGPPPEN
ncbi:MAG: hypothetical protein WC469_02655 [Candidatus Omnitrophota bacterium]